FRIELKDDDIRYRSHEIGTVFDQRSSHQESHSYFLFRSFNIPPTFLAASSPASSTLFTRPADTSSIQITPVRLLAAAAIWLMTSCAIDCPTAVAWWRMPRGSLIRRFSICIRLLAIT